ncbi:hypothetical protein [Xenorhabdus sp. KK7.4]|uniref:hypothetical protein n=1 Tax=Xenorhabdus sp. KK7.4 TaxID=1851572 RepID=UPI000C055F58|nr:hypothetical protein [Xenorhabdus sp. KK7.4]PHM55837.1 hypothetical protein Xekk_02175 [Xenorhabdus sp. KK7.4]
MNLKQNNDLIITGLPTFTLILLDGKREGELFANGNMQIGIAIDILAANVHLDKVTLSPEQLDSIELLDIVTHEKLTGDWTYSSDENDYSHTYPRGDVTRDINLSSGRDTTKDDGSQRKVYWLKTKKEETKEIIAKITLCGKEYLSYHNVTADGSYIDVHGRRAIVYHPENIDFKFIENFTSGKYEFKSTETTHSIFGDETHPPTFSYHDWIQNNYYIFPLSGYEVKDVYVQHTKNDENPNRYDYLRFTHHTRDNDLFLWFIWGRYKEEEKNAGASYNMVEKDKRDITIRYEATPQVKIVTTPRTDVVSMSRLYFESPLSKRDGIFPDDSHFWNDKPNQVPQFKFHDIYGNESVFIKIIMNNADKFHFQEG